jgi:serine/threonine protein kinase
MKPGWRPASGETLGKGTYGEVVKAKDKRTSAGVALGDL